jgi:crotonobetainyl-CoA:carnitine CoA-transferase CaiB-like acyl-CoA transferase
MKSLKVLDMSRLLPGPLSGQLLTRLGATVVKVDSPSKQYGDYVRHLPPILK